MGDIAPASFETIYYWSKLYRRRLEPWEITALIDLDGVLCSQSAEVTAKRREQKTTDADEDDE